MEQALWDEVLLKPDDDAPRRVLADFLQERGDPRGELIALQCALALVPKDEWGLNELELQARCEKLISEHGLKWLPDWPIDTIPEFVRGFPDHLSERSHAFAEAAPRIFDSAPSLLSLKLVDQDPQLWRSGFARVLATKDVTRLRRLSLPIVYGPTDIATLASARTLSKLSSLDFYGGTVGRPGIAALVQSFFRGALRELSFGFAVGWGDKWPDELGAFELTTFRSRANVVGDVATAFPNLRTLALSETPLQNAAGLGALRHLTTLELDNVQLSRKGLSALGQGFAKVRRFSLSRQPKALGVLTDKWPALESVDLRATALGDDGIVLLVDRPWTQQVRRLVLAENGLTDAAAKRLAEAPLPMLRRLDVSGNKLTREGIDRLERRGWLVVT